MKKSFKKKYILLSMLSIILFSLAPFNSASNNGGSVVSEECGSLSPYDYHGLMECQIASYTGAGSAFYKDQATFYHEQIINVTRGSEIDVSKTAQYFGFFRYLFVGFLILFTILNGYSFMTSQGDPMKREQATKTFKYIIVAGVLLALLPILLSTIYNLSSAITQVVLDQSKLSLSPENIPLSLPNFEDPGEIGADQEVATFSNYHKQIPSFITASRVYIISMSARHILVLLLLSISPLILLGYVYLPLRSYASLLTGLLILELIYPAIAIIVLHFSLVLSGSELNYLLLSSALWVCVLFHAILLIAIMLKATMHVIMQIRYSEVKE